MSTTEIKAYVAGFIDGEGCLSITKARRGRSKNYCYRFSIHITQKNKLILEWIQGHYGGRIYKIPNKQYDKLYQLVLGTKQSINLIEDIKPYIILKSRHISVVENYLWVKKKFSHKGRRSSEVYLKLQERCKLRLNKLNSNKP